MENQFTSHDISLKLKELGFNEPCMAMYQKNKKLWYTKKKEWIFNHETNTDNRTLKTFIRDYPDMIYSLPNGKKVIKKCFNFAAPLWQQAIDFFRETYHLDITIKFPEAKNGKYGGINSIYYDIELKHMMQGDAWNRYKLEQFTDDFYEAREKAILCAIQEVETFPNLYIRITSKEEINKEEVIDKQKFLMKTRCSCYDSDCMEIKDHVLCFKGGSIGEADGFCPFIHTKI